MRSISVNNVNELQVTPDTHTTLLLAASAAQASDFAADTQIVRITGMSSAGAALNFYVNLQSTAAAIPTSGTTATTGSTGVSVPVIGTRTFAVAGSTGFSAISLTSGYFTAECWRR